jgi:hypothetical protein
MVNYNKRTQEEIDLTNFYLDKWDKILYSTQPVDRAKAEAAVLNAYHHIGMPTPEIYFLTSPSRTQMSTLSSMTPEEGGYFLDLKDTLQVKLLNVFKNIKLNIFTNLLLAGNDFLLFDPSNKGIKFEKLCAILYEEYIWEVGDYYNANFYKIIDSEVNATNAWFYDLYVEHVISNLELDLKDWHILRNLNQECPYLVTFSDACIIIERPCELHLDRLLLPHADGKAAILYSDGHKIHCDHGVIIPAKYGEVYSSEWQSRWILSEEQNPTSSYIHEQEDLLTILRFRIGYKKIREELPDSINPYWLKDGNLSRWCGVIGYGLDIIFEWILFHHYEYYNGMDDVDWQGLCIVKKYPFNPPIDELEIFYQICQRNYQLAPGLNFYHFYESSISVTTGFSVYPILRLFHGDSNEIYYILCDNKKKVFSNIYCKFPDRETVVYAECLTSWIATIAQCYQEGAYYIAIDPESGERKIEQDLDKVEPIFEKFNPNQIDAWRSIWKEVYRSDDFSS